MWYERGIYHLLATVSIRDEILGSTSENVNYCKFEVAVATVISYLSCRRISIRP